MFEISPELEQIQYNCSSVDHKLNGEFFVRPRDHILKGQCHEKFVLTETLGV